MFYLFGFIAAMFAGSLSHELAHWMVWRATGRRPKMHWWQLYVEPRAGPATVNGFDRVAAAAPYAVGTTVLLVAVLASSYLVGAFGLGMVFLPSRSDWRTIRGRGEWALE